MVKSKYWDDAQLASSENWKRITDEFNTLKGQFVITEHKGNTVERLIGIGSDDMDWYYLTYNGRDIKWCSCVARIMPLKGFIEDKHYNYFIHMSELNDDDQIFLKNDKYDEFEKGVDEYLSKLGEKEEILLGLYWDLDKII